MFRKKVKRPWGNYTVLSDKPNHLVKRVVVNPGARLILHKHKHRSEHCIFTEGIGAVTRIYSDRDFKEHKRWLVLNVFKGNCVFIDEEVIHRVENTRENRPLIFIEVQIGDSLKEDDIIRLEEPLWPQR